MDSLSLWKRRAFEGGGGDVAGKMRLVDITSLRQDPAPARKAKAKWLVQNMVHPIRVAEKDKVKMPKVQNDPLQIPISWNLVHA
jgi:hypothetical protein